MQNVPEPTDSIAQCNMVQSDLSALVEKEVEERRERWTAEDGHHTPTEGGHLKGRGTVKRRSTLTVPNVENREDEEQRTRGYYAGVATCAAGIIGTLVCYGILQERIMTRPYGERTPHTQSAAFRNAERLLD